MFNVGPMEFIVLALIGLIVLGPDKLPTLARDAAKMLRTLRELATGARTQLKNELGPELADVDLSALRELRSLNPRTAITRALLGDDEDAADAPQKPADLDPSAANAAKPPAQQPLGRGEPAPFDPDAT
ncbi:MAG: sec-independent translocase [Actinomycetota bacterium]